MWKAVGLRRGNGKDKLVTLIDHRYAAQPQSCIQHPDCLRSVQLRLGTQRDLIWHQSGWPQHSAPGKVLIYIEHLNHIGVIELDHSWMEHFFASNGFCRWIRNILENGGVARRKDNQEILTS